MLEAQKYSLQIKVGILPPYNPYLSDFNTPDNEVVVIEVEPTSDGRYPEKVKLQLEIERTDIPTITLRTKSDNPVAAINLNENTGAAGSKKKYITGIDRYLNPDNLEIKGKDRDFFLQSKQLPEGTYKFRVTLVEPGTNKLLSNTSTVTLHIKWLDAPVVQPPAFPDVRTAVFSWSESLDSLARSFVTEYVFELAMLTPNDDAKNPTSAFVSDQMILTLTELRTTLVRMDLDKTSLIPGKQYAIRVTAYHPKGKHLFKDKGQSKVYVFQR